jgi:fibronectin type 3 domain-containing protein
MRWHAPVFFTLTASAALLLACGGERPLAPSVTPDGAGVAMASGSDLLPPSNVSAVAPSDGRIDVRWQETSTNETGFEVHRSTTGSAGPFALLTTTGANAVAHSDLGLQTATEYCYSVRAVRVVGSKIFYSVFANIACTTTTPTPPSNATAVAVASSDAQIDLTWQDNSSVEAGYEIHRSQSGATGSFQLLATTANNVAAYSDHWVVPVAQYCYQIRALGVIGNGASASAFSNTVCLTTPPPSLPPVSGYTVGAKAWSSSWVAVSVKWTDVSRVASYRMYRSTDGGAAWEQVNLTGSDGIFWDGRPSEQLACYRVVAYNAAGDAAPSNTACTTPPAGPTDLAATIVDAQTLELTWTDNSSVEAGYQLWVRYYRAAIGCYADVAGAMDTGTIEGEFLVADLPANSTTYLATQWSDGSDCFPRMSYWFYVVATKDGARSDSSNEVDASIAPPPPAPSSSHALLEWR